MSHYTDTNLTDRAAQREHERETRANNDDGSKGGYNIRPNIFKPPRLLTFRVADNYLYTYALLEANNHASRINRGRIHDFMRWNRSVKTRRALYSPTYCGQPAPKVNIEPPKRSAA